MGPMNGVRFAVHLLQTFPECKVILVSGNVVTVSRLFDPISDAGGHKFPILPKLGRKFMLAIITTITTNSREAAKPLSVQPPPPKTGTERIWGYSRKGNLCLPHIIVWHSSV